MRIDRRCHTTVALLAVAAGCLVGATASARAANATWAGTWSAPGSYLGGTLTLTGDALGFQGTWVNVSLGAPTTRGTIRGSLSNAKKRVFKGTWDRAAFGSNPRSTGTLTVTWSKNGKSFTGTAKPDGGPWDYFNGRCTAGACTHNSRVVLSEPKLPDALVSLRSVSNGCGGGTASTDPRWGDTSTYLNSNNPLGKRYLVNFRTACNLHDAGYSGAKVRDPLHRSRIVDFFGWSQAEVDRKFLDNMREICAERIPASASVALADCKGTGGKTSIGAESRYNAVRAVGWMFWNKRLHVTGTWTDQANPGSSAWSMRQYKRTVTAHWSSGSNTTGTFRGTLISRDTDTIIVGYVTADEGGDIARGPESIRFDSHNLDVGYLTGTIGPSAIVRR